MGMISRLWSKALRPLRTFNVANRAERAISNPKPVPAPKYKANVEELERILKANPDIVDKHAKKDSSLDNRLKDIFVSSTDPDSVKPERISSRYNPEKPLPLDKGTVPFYEFGFKEPETVQPGFITIRGILQLISDHKKHPKLSTGITAKRYGLPEEAVCNILEYYGAFELHMPKKSKKNKDMPEYEMERIEGPKIN